MWQQIAQEITKATGNSFVVATTRSVGGGCINQGYQLQGNDSQYFVKLNQASQIAMFQAEYLGLTQMYDTQTITIPKPICWGVAGNSCYLVLEWLDLAKGNYHHSSWLEMGRQLAQMHALGKADRYGWLMNNTIGSTPQINTWKDNWADFFAEQRIAYQLQLAQKKGGNFSHIDRVVEVVRAKLAERQPEASLVHGDLWSGNADITADGQPTIFDPATYYGDREVDIAMTELFGGFPDAFYQGYNQQWQLDAAYSQRKSIYNLYHILNHFNLFGGSYGFQAQQMINRLFDDI